jgi:ElaB/YqjD/DUF883 family membrane-anchored ribosome-binding protein
MDLEAAKTATVDSMEVAMESKSNRFHAGRNEVETQKETIIVNQPENNTTTTDNHNKKKGWSSTAKGAVIGAGVGAATGAIISKKKSTGAIIGGVAGAGMVLVPELL